MEVLRFGWYILRNEVKAWAEYIGAKYFVGLVFGLDVLVDPRYTASKIVIH